MFARNSIAVTIAFLLTMASVHTQTARGQEPQEQQENELPTVLQKLKNGSIRFTEADQIFDELKVAIEKNPDADWSRSVNLLATAIAHKGDFDKAVTLVHDRYRNRFSKAKSAGKLNGLVRSVESIVKNCGVSSRPNLGDEVLDEFIPAFRIEVRNNGGAKGWLLVQLIKLVGSRCLSLEKDEAEAMLQSELQHAEEFRNQSPDSPLAISPLIEVKKILAAGDFPGGKVDLKIVSELPQLIEEAAPEMHEIVWAMLVYDTYRYLIQNSMFEHPDEALELTNAAIEIFESESEEDESFRAMFAPRIKEFKSYPKSISRYKELRKLIGTPAVEFDSAAWINGEPSTLSKHAGQVVLLDFTAVWCGPCIALIPELNALHRDHSNSGLAIISVTDQDEFVWDKERNKAIRSKTPTSLENQIDLQKRFVAKHKQLFPVMVAKKNSAMFKSYGVGSIPHGVLIDREGVIREIISGNTIAGKRRLKRRVRELMADHN